MSKIRDQLMETEKRKLFIYLFCCLCFEQTHFNSLFSPFFFFPDQFAPIFAKF